jgi:hypothetical protein
MTKGGVMLQKKHGKNHAFKYFSIRVCFYVGERIARPQYTVSIAIPQYSMLFI